MPEQPQETVGSDLSLPHSLGKVRMGQKPALSEIQQNVEHIPESQPQTTAVPIPLPPSSSRMPPNSFGGTDAPSQKGDVAQPEKKKSAPSQSRLKANRQNAKASTGPRTPEGISASSMNALSHGLLANRALLIHPDFKESAELLTIIPLGFIESLHPLGLVEQMLVERIAVGYWRLMRCMQAERGQITQNLVASVNDDSWVDTKWQRNRDFVIAHSLAKMLPDGKDLSIDKLIRYETFLQRQIDKAIAQLDHIQAARRDQKHISFGNPF